MSANGDMLSL